MRHAWARGLGTAAAAVLVSLAPVARAQSDADVQRARELFAAATDDEENQRWADALAKLRQVQTVKDTAGVRFHIGNCEEHLGRIAEALADFQRADEQAKAENANDVAQLAPPRLHDVEARVPRLTIDVPAEVHDSARVVLDGAALDPAKYGQQTFVDPGDHVIEAMAPGRKPLKQTVTMKERSAVVFTVSLPPEAGPIVPPPPPPPPPPPHPRPSKAGAIVATVGAAAFLGGGIAAFVLAGGAHDDGQNECATRRTSCSDLKPPVQAWDAVALGTWIGAAALGTVAVILWTSNPEPARGAAPAPHVAVRLAPGALVLGGGF